MNPSETSPIYTGTQINYYFVCQRKLWLFSHGLNMEQTSDTVYLGKLVGEESYEREKKEIQIDNLITIDFIGNDRVIHEVKKSNKMEQAHEFQLLYYLYYLKQKGIEDVTGKINYPQLRRTADINLTLENEQKLNEVFVAMEKIISRQQLPERMKISFCKKCSYYELCWVEE
jgi:CRISPR-associated exonuclease Cas4